MVFTIEQFPGYRYEIEISEELANYIELNPDEANAYFVNEFDAAFAEWIASQKRNFS